MNQKEVFVEQPWFLPDLLDMLAELAVCPEAGMMMSATLQPAIVSPRIGYL